MFYAVYSIAYSVVNQLNYLGWGRERERERERERVDFFLLYLTRNYVVFFGGFPHLLGALHRICYRQNYIFLTSLVITEYSISDVNLLGTDLFPLKFPLYNRIFT